MTTKKLHSNEIALGDAPQSPTSDAGRSDAPAVLVARHPGLRALEAVLRDLTKALKETDSERKGGFPNRTTLYGLDLVQARRACGGKLDITPLAFPYGGFCIGDADSQPRPTGVENAALNTAAVAAKMG